MFSKLIGSERAELESKSIQYLRKLADAIGVDSPTLMGKEDLIDEILVVLMGGKLAKKKETRGRPKKDYRPKVFDDFTSEFEKDIVVEYDYAVPRGLGIGVFSSGAGDEEALRERRNQIYDKYVNYYERQLRENEKKLRELELQKNFELSFGEEIKKYITSSVEELLSDSRYEIKYGYVYVENEKLYILQSGFDIANKVEITDLSLVEKDCLRVGDEVHYYLSDNNIPIILMANGFDIDEVQDRKKFSNLKIGYPNAKVNSINIINKIAPIAFGSRNVVVGNIQSSRFIGSKLLKKISKKEKDAYIYALGLDLTKEEFLALQGSTDVLLNLSSTSDKSQELTKINLFSERIKRLAELGFDVILYIDNYSNFASVISDSNVSTIIKELFGLGAKIKNLGSITTIAICGEFEDSKELKELLTNKIRVSNSNTNEDSSMIQVEECNTLFTDKFLTIGEIEEMEGLKRSWKSMSGLDKNQIINKYE